MNPKIQCFREREPRYTKNEGEKELRVTMALPFFRSRFGEYIHRVRSGKVYISKDKYSHTALRFWCGGHGFIDKGELFATPPEHAIHCATCEGKAIGAGLEGNREIAGRAVLYKPRT